MNTNEAMAVLKKSKVFHNLDDSTLDTLIFLSYTRELSEGETIYTKGELSNDRFGLILAGGVNIVKKDGSIFTVLGIGEVVGEIALSDPNRRRTMTVTAAGPTEMLEWDVNHVKKEAPDVWKNLVKLAWEHMREYYEDIE